MSIISLIKEDLFLVSGAEKCHCGKSDESARFYIGHADSLDECREACDKKGYKGARLFAGCDYTCLGKCFFKCSLTTGETVDDMITSVATKDCKNGCHPKCGCVTVT